MLHSPLFSISGRRSVVPTPFTGYSFHVIEAVIVFANEVLVCFLFPIHMGLHRWYHMLTTTLIHMGTTFEVHPLLPIEHDAQSGARPPKISLQVATLGTKWRP